jgi:hypothetical protein
MRLDFFLWHATAQLAYWIYNRLSFGFVGCVPL